MWIYIDADNRVQGWNPNNMSGNTGWVLAVAAPPENYMDYLYINDEYVYDPLPEPEPPEPTPTDSERITALEEQLAAYEAAYQQGVNEA